MTDKEIDVLKNVLVCKGKNKLQLCDIHFNNRIRELKVKTDHLFDWEDLKKIRKRNSLLGQFVKDNSRQKFLLAIPGGIDPHVHFDTPGYEFREDFEHASLAAACGGTTLVIDMPCTSVPPVTSVDNLEKKLSALTGRSYIDYAFWGGVPGNNFDEKTVAKNIKLMAERGVAGFKAYMLSGMDSFSSLYPHQMEFAARVISKTGKPLAVHAEDKEIVSFHEQRFRAIDRNDWSAYCSSRNVQAEEVAVKNLIALSSKTDCKIHIVHLSSKKGLNLIREAQSNDVSITAETCPHYLYFTQKDFENKRIRNFLKTAPPVKYEEDKEELWKGLADGSILFVATDHAGCNPKKEKSSKNFWEVYGGIPEVEHRVPFLFSEGFLKGRLTLEKTIDLLSKNAAKYFGIKDKGSFKIGNDADITLVDLWNSQEVLAADMHSKGKYTPFEGIKLNAVIKKTFVRGKLIAENEININGSFVKI
jgi:allantoinase